MAGAVVFDYTVWATRYPELAASVASPLAEIYFNEAQLYCDNSTTSPVHDGCRRAALLGMVTAHIAALNAPLNGQPAVTVVGRIAHATEGSVSVKSENNYLPGSAQWWQQTKYGAAFWAASADCRLMCYAPAVNVPMGRWGRRF